MVKLMTMANLPNGVQPFSLQDQADENSLANQEHAEQIQEHAERIEQLENNVNGHSRYFRQIFIMLIIGLIIVLLIFFFLHLKISNHGQNTSVINVSDIEREDL